MLSRPARRSQPGRPSVDAWTARLRVRRSARSTDPRRLCAPSHPTGRGPASRSRRASQSSRAPITTAGPNGQEGRAWRSPPSSRCSRCAPSRTAGRPTGIRDHRRPGRRRDRRVLRRLRPHPDRRRRVRHRGGWRAAQARPHRRLGAVVRGGHPARSTIWPSRRTPSLGARPMPGSPRSSAGPNSATELHVCEIYS